MYSISPHSFDQLKIELDDLERELVIVDGVWRKPSQCYHLETDPAHVLFNTNCPHDLRTRIEAILAKYTGNHESGT